MRDCMAIFMLEQYTTESDKLNEFGGFIKKYLAWLMIGVQLCIRKLNRIR